MDDAAYKLRINKEGTDMKMPSGQMMNFVNIFQKESDISIKQLVAVALASAISESLVLVVILAVAKTASSKDINFRYLLMYLVAVAFSIYGRRYTLLQSSIASETIVRKIKIRIADKIRKSDLVFLESLGIGDIYAKVTTNTQLISMSTFLITCGIQSAMLTAFCILYLATLSMLAFSVTIIAISIIVIKYIHHEKVFARDYQKVIHLEGKFCDMLNDTLAGFKELKMSQARSNDHFGVFTDIVTEAESYNVKAQTSFAMKMIFTQSSFYFLLGATGFLLPRLGQDYSELIISITTVIFFLIGPINLVISSIPNYFKVNIALSTLYQLEEMLDAKTHHEVATPPIKHFEEISWEDVTFDYRDTENVSLFTVGPLSFSLKQGEIIFVIGGNGSGKSTLLKLITGLYYPDSGRIKADGELIGQERYDKYRELFSVIFADFHLFNRLYGMSDIDYDRVAELLYLMNLESKTEVKKGEFSTINLSTGQKKRIAMIVALLEDRPIYIFDEWAADQDPGFKKYFYETLLQDLKAQGKTVIAVSHDDRFFHHADRILKMEYGKFVDDFAIHSTSPHPPGDS
jgi:putative ATP-binding cassette transporter